MENDMTGRRRSLFSVRHSRFISTKISLLLLSYDIPAQIIYRMTKGHFPYFHSKFIPIFDNLFSNIPEFVAEYIPDFIALVSP